MRSNLRGCKFNANVEKPSVIYHNFRVSPNALCFRLELSRETKNGKGSANSDSPNLHHHIIPTRHEVKTVASRCLRSLIDGFDRGVVIRVDDVIIFHNSFPGSTLRFYVVTSVVCRLVAYNSVHSGDGAVHVHEYFETK